jgi:hypothetical protein
VDPSPSMVGGVKLDLLSPRAAEDVAEYDDDADRLSSSSDSSDDDDRMGKMYIIQVKGGSVCVCVCVCVMTPTMRLGRRYAERGSRPHNARQAS